MMIAVADLPTILFVPGNRPERFDKAAASGAPAIVIDLEDAVAPPGKDAARVAILSWLAGRGNSKVAAGVRINTPYNRHGLQDLLRLFDGKVRPDFIVLSKVESPFEPLLVHRHSGGVPLICTIESVLGLSRALEIARGAPSIASLAFGGADLAADLRAEFSWDALFHARGALVQASAAAGVGMVDVPYINLKDDAGLADECRKVRALGFTGKFAIHPRHVAAILEAFAPTAEEAQRAAAILAAAAKVGGDVLEFEGRMIDEALLRTARRIVAQASARAGAGA